MQPSHWADDASDTSDEASVATIEDIASDSMEPLEGAAEASFIKFRFYLEHVKLPIR